MRRFLKITRKREEKRIRWVVAKLSNCLDALIPFLANQYIIEWF